MEQMMERRERKNIPLQQDIYTVALCVITLKTMLDSSSLWRRPEWLDAVMLVTYFGFIFCKLLLQEFRWRQLIVIAAVGICCVYTCFSVRYFTLLFTFTMIIGMQYVDLKKTLNTTANLKLIFLAVHVFAYLLTYMVSPETIQYSHRMGGSARHYFFLGHANTFSAYLIWAMLEKLYANEAKRKGRHIVLVWVVYFVFYQFTDSRTSLIICTMACGLMLIDHYFPNCLGEPLRIVARFSYAIVAVFFTVMSAGYTSFSGGMLDFFDNINRFFTGRLLYGAYLYDRFGPTMLGQVIYLPGSVVYWHGNWIDCIIMDNCFIMLLEYYGWIYMVLIAIALLWIMRRNTMLGTVERILTIAYVYFAIMENYATNAVYCFPLLFIGTMIYQGNVLGGENNEV